MDDTQYITDIDELESQLTKRVKSAKAKRIKPQRYISEILNISLTKIKEIEKGTCKDFNAINNYINFLGENMIIL